MFRQIHTIRASLSAGLVVQSVTQGSRRTNCTLAVSWQATEALTVCLGACLCVLPSLWLNSRRTPQIRSFRYFPEVSLLFPSHLSTFMRQIHEASRDTLKFLIQVDFFFYWPGFVFVSNWCELYEFNKV